MQNNKKTIVITILIWAGFTSLCLAATTTSKTIPKHPTAFELLDRYAENQDKFKSFIVRTVTSMTEEDITKDGIVSQSSESKWEIELRYEDDGGNFRAYLCPRHLQSASDESLVPEDRYHRNLWNGKIYFEHHKRPTVDDSGSYISSDKQYIKDAIAIGYP
ncbi:MAG: hypothetical protein FVQ84_07820 [Planctomycetes bacterium]|nr:hypothetical protein [Planctomycetota bacterium]